MNKPLFQIIFNDNSIMNGGDYEHTKWLNIPNKSIRTLFYLLPTGDYLGLNGYKKYYHFIECTTDLNGKNAGVKQLEYDYILGQDNEFTIVYKINLKNKDIKILKYNNTDEFIENLNPEFWR